MSDVIFTKIALEDFMYWVEHDRKMVRRINSLILDIQRNGMLSGIGKPEILKHDR